MSFDDALIESAVVHFESMQTGRSWKVEKVGGELTATSLLGPLRGLLAFELSGVPATLSFAVGDFGVGKAYPVSIDVKADGSTKVEASFSGIVTRTAGISRLDGSLSGRVGPAPSEDAAQPADPRRVEFSSAAVIGQNGAEFRTVQIKSAAGTISGAGRLGWRERLKLTGELTSSSFTVDRLRDIFGPSEEVLEALINSDFPLVDVIDLALSADAVILDRRAYRDVSVALKGTADDLELVSAKAGLPGGSLLLAAGRRIRDEDGAGRFDGQISFDSPGLARLLAAYAAQEDIVPDASVQVSIAPAPVRDRPVHLTGRLAATATRVDLSDIDASVTDRGIEKSGKPNMRLIVGLADYDQ